MTGDKRVQNVTKIQSVKNDAVSHVQQMQALHRCTTTMSRGRRQTRRKLLMQRRKTRATDAAAVNEIT